VLVKPEDGDETSIELWLRDLIAYCLDEKEKAPVDGAGRMSGWR
jgi:hypothetical protein